MLGSEHAGERAAAGLKAEAFRRQHRLTWQEMLKPVVLNIPLRRPEPPVPEPPIWAPPQRPQTQWNRTKWGSRIGLTTFGLVWIIIIAAAFWGTI
jgi:hypothetical protein